MRTTCIRAEQFSVMKMAQFVTWWVDEGHRPALNEAQARLDLYNARGNSDDASAGRACRM